METLLSLALLKSAVQSVLARLIALLCTVFLLVAPCLAQVALIPASIPDPIVGAPYFQLFNAIGGTPPYQISLAGPLPAGMSFSSETLSGTPTESGMFTFSVFASDFAGTTDSHSYTLNIGPPAISVSPGSLPAGAVGSGYSQSLSAFGGTAPYNFSVSGTLPSGISMTPAGLLSGMPLSAGSHTFSVIVTDSTTGGGPYSASIPYTLVIAPPSLTLSPTLPSATVGQAYAETISATGGAAPYTFSLASGALPAGLSLGTDGSISGTAQEDGTFNFTISAQDSTGGAPITGSQAYSLSVAPPTITLSPASLPNGRAGGPYSATIVAGGGTAPYTYAVTGSLPAGMTLSSSGLLSGTPTETGSFSFGVTATDASGGTGPHMGTQTLSLDIYSPSFTLQPSSLPPATAGQPYSQTVVAGGGTSPYAYSIMAGALPSGLTFSAGTISGTPTASGSFFVTILAQDSTTGPGAPYGVAGYFPLTVVTPTIILAPASLPSANSGSFYSQTLTASGGAAPYAFAISSGSLPPGLSLSSSGTLSGMPTASGVFDFSVTATDSSVGVGPFSATQAFSVTVGAVGRLIVAVRSNVDGTFGFTSSEPLLNALTVGTTGGIGGSASIELPAGAFRITADDLSGAGTTLTGIDCDDDDSGGDIATRTADIVIDASESLTCVFTFVSSREETTALIKDFLETRASMILANQPRTQRRIDRLNGIVPGGDIGSTLMNYLPAIAGGSALRSSISLNAIEGATGNQSSNPLDIWMEGTFMRIDAARDGRLMLGSVGADYLVTPDLLIGGFVQLDHMMQGEAGLAGAAMGSGWIAGPYATMRLHEHLYLDLLAGFGRSNNRINPLGTYEDSFGATRWLLSAAIEGQWTSGPWTFSPRASLGYFSETSDAYRDALGIAIPSIATGVGQIAIGPAVSYRFVAPGEIVVDLGLGLEGVAEFGSNLLFENGQARLEASIDAGMPSGADIGLTIGLGGIGNANRGIISISGRVFVPMN
ncbi:putative Ig domain-containing protein (plasmid) [Devosia neptuniae]|uniref:Ig domain-containing protein n=1 Tax=Devosia neptuniae TaxID=191302 RepID=A0ABY6CAL1_9HYPH|nr:putative Ig domain-containing protein [Devosia neptuniae]UXN68021.1 putative Ig domain-containing protein [Devosia neptuniae]